MINDHTTMNAGATLETNLGIFSKYSEFESMLFHLLSHHLREDGVGKLNKATEAKDRLSAEYTEASTRARDIQNGLIVKRTVIQLLERHIAEFQSEIEQAREREIRLSAELTAMSQALSEQTQVPAQASAPAPAQASAQASGKSPRKQQVKPGAVISSPQSDHVVPAQGNGAVEQGAASAPRGIIQVKQELSETIALVSVKTTENNKRVNELRISQEQLAALEESLTQAQSAMAEKAAELQEANQNVAEAESKAEVSNISAAVVNAWNSNEVKAQRKALEKQFNEYKSQSKYNANYNNLTAKLWRGAKFVVATAFAAAIAYTAAIVTPAVMDIVSPCVSKASIQPFVNVAANSWNQAKDYLINNVASWIKATPAISETLNASSTYAMPIGRVIASCASDAANMVAYAAQNPLAQNAATSVANSVQSVATYVQEDGYAGVIAKITAAALVAVGVLTASKAVRLPYSLLAPRAIDVAREDKLGAALKTKAGTFLEMVEQRVESNQLQRA